MEKKRRQIGIFGGSFNPIHIGHLALSNYLCEYTELDEIWFMVSPRNPLKEAGELWDDDLRLSLVRAAVKEYPKLHASDFEFSLPRPSYTYHTLCELKKVYPQYDFTLIIGADNWEVFPRWKFSEEILRGFPVYIYPRPNYHIDTTMLPPTAKFLPTPMFEISSSFIREAIRGGKDIRFFLHPTTYELLTDLANHTIL